MKSAGSSGVRKANKLKLTNKNNKMKIRGCSHFTMYDKKTLSGAVEVCYKLLENILRFLNVS